MTDAIFHRGPDDEGFYFNSNIGLGFRRLSIIDLKTGHQPISSADGRYTIIFNGEIYNFQIERSNLEKKGYKFFTNTDTEVILNLFIEYGEDCLKHLRGMFAFVIWDSIRKSLFCARDRFGIKPFFYYYDNEKLIFASEIKALLNSALVFPTINIDAVNQYFAYGYISDDLTIYKEINKLKASHWARFSPPYDKNIDIQQYWEVCFEPDYSKNEAYWLDQFEELFFDTIKLHMISDVQLGAFLSGGIDSSAVVALMARAQSNPIKTFSIGFQEEEYNELFYAKKVSDLFNTEFNYKILDSSSIDLLRKIVHIYDEPFADISAIPTYIVSQFARNDVAVVLSGDGGDELFAGYDHYLKLHKIFSHFNGNRNFLNKFWELIYLTFRPTWKGRGLAYYLSKNGFDLPAYMMLWNTYERKKLFNKDVQSQIVDRAETSRIELLSRGKKVGFLASFQQMDMKTLLPDDFLTKVDRASMANSLEIRVPFLDHILAEFTFKIPNDYKVNSNDQKILLKKILAKYVPKEVVTHKKHGFAVPITYWFREDLVQFLKTYIQDNSIEIDQYFNTAYINKVLGYHQHGYRDFSHKIWSLIFFIEWVNMNKHQYTVNYRHK